MARDARDPIAEKEIADFRPQEAGLKGSALGHYRTALRNFSDALDGNDRAAVEQTLMTIKERLKVDDSDARFENPEDLLRPGVLFPPHILVKLNAFALNGGMLTSFSIARERQEEERKEKEEEKKRFVHLIMTAAARQALYDAIDAEMGEEIQAGIQAFMRAKTPKERASAWAHLHSKIENSRSLAGFLEQQKEEIARDKMIQSVAEHYARNERIPIHAAQAKALADYNEVMKNPDTKALFEKLRGLNVANAASAKPTVTPTNPKSLMKKFTPKAKGPTNIDRPAPEDELGICVAEPVKQMTVEDLRAALDESKDAVSKMDEGPAKRVLSAMIAQKEEELRAARQAFRKEFNAHLPELTAQTNAYNALTAANIIVMDVNGDGVDRVVMKDAKGYFAKTLSGEVLRIADKGLVDLIEMRLKNGGALGNTNLALSTAFEKANAAYLAAQAKIAPLSDNLDAKEEALAQAQIKAGESTLNVPEAFALILKNPKQMEMASEFYKKLNTADRSMDLSGLRQLDLMAQHGLSGQEFMAVIETIEMSGGKVVLPAFDPEEGAPVLPEKPKAMASAPIASTVANKFYAANTAQPAAIKPPAAEHEPAPNRTV